MTENQVIILYWNGVIVRPIFVILSDRNKLLCMTGYNFRRGAEVITSHYVNALSCIMTKTNLPETTKALINMSITITFDSFDGRIDCWKYAFNIVLVQRRHLFLLQRNYLKYYCQHFTPYHNKQLHIFP
jgi:hypothetical protein